MHSLYIKERHSKTWILKSRHFSRSTAIIAAQRYLRVKIIRESSHITEEE